MFSKILIANRGEIACRVAATARRMGVKTVAVYSDADADAKHVAVCDEAVHIGPAAARESYLLGDRIIAAALASGAQAIHPGYGFLSENAAFAAACADAGLCFIGPPASAIRAMGSKSAAKALMEKAGVPLVPGYHGDDQTPALLHEAADRIGYPVLLKASAGGGGKGMRIVERSVDFIAALASCKREAASSFGDDKVLVERYLQRPRHIEIQVFADTHGACVFLFERDCSVQRRHQKVLEEAPAPGLSDARRAAMGEAAVAAARAVGYVGAGTVEFIAEESRPGEEGAFYFMEMNTRLQVEHPVTEMITGQDLVAWQLLVAAGQPLPLRQSQLAIHGHAIEARIYAENPEKGFLPSTGTLAHLATPAAVEFTLGMSASQVADFAGTGTGTGAGAGAGAGTGIDGGAVANTGVASVLQAAATTAATAATPATPARVRIDSGVRAGDAISPFYDPMIAKLIVWGPDRAAALAEMRDALRQYQVVGLSTNIAFLQRLIGSTAFAGADLDTGLIERHHAELFPAVAPAPLPVLALACAAILGDERAAATAPADAGDPWAAHTGWRMHARLQRSMELSDAGHSDGQTQTLVVGYLHDGYLLQHGTQSVLMALLPTHAAAARAGAGSVGSTAAAGTAAFTGIAGSPSTAGNLGSAGSAGALTIRLGSDIVRGRVVREGESLHVFHDGVHSLLVYADPMAHAGVTEIAGGRLTAPMPGKIVAVLVAAGDTVAAGTPLVIMEAMKMEHTIAAPHAGVVDAVLYAVGDQVADGAPLLSFRVAEAVSATPAAAAPAAA